MKDINNNVWWFFFSGLALGNVALFLTYSLLARRKSLRNLRKEVYPINKIKKENSHDYLIVADGPFILRNILLEAAINKYIIALDNAANRLAALGIMPDTILGDFDSIENPADWGITHTFNEISDETKPYVGKHNIQIVPAKNQDLTDLQKAIRFCDQQEAKSIHIVCATGARMDHTLYNVRTLRAEHKPNRKIYLHTESQTLQYVKDEKCVIRGIKGDYCGIMAFPEAKFTSEGLEYNGENFPLTFAASESVCNRLSADVANITVQGEALLIMPGLFSSQREFTNKSKT